MLIKTFIEKILTIDIEPSNAIVKEQIENEKGSPMNQQRFISRDFQLDDGQIVSYDKIVHIFRNETKYITSLLQRPSRHDIKTYLWHYKLAITTTLRNRRFDRSIKWKKKQLQSKILQLPSLNHDNFFHYNNQSHELSFKLLEQNPYTAQLKQVYPLSIREHQLTNEMIYIIRQYTSHYYMNTNMKLLSNFNIDWNYTNKLRSIIRSLCQLNLRNVYYRGLNLSDTEVSYYIEKVNQFYYTNSFLSFTTDKGLAFPGNALIVLKTTSGNRLNIANVWKWSSYPHEMEAILSVGSKLKILGVYTENIRWIIRVELVENE